jgi:TP901 family phage tail tape measure protein
MFNLSAVLNFVGANTAGVRGAINQVTSQLNSGTKSAKTFSDAVALKGIQLAAYGAAGAAVIKLTESISRATSDAIRFEYELAKIAQTVNQTNSDVNRHADSIRQMAVAYGLSAPKIAETIRVLAQAGYTLKQAKEAADSLAQTTLLASFESIADTTDGLIAINKQFVETMGDSAQVLAVLNNISKKYAVESSDLVEAVRKAGGVFSATGGKMEELVAIFTTVRDTTRESAETIATGLRTIFSRLQRPKTIEYMRQFGIELTDLKGNFVGNFEAIQRIQEGIKRQGIVPKSTVFAGIVEEIGGIRQQSRVIPLLVQANKLQQVYQDTQTAGVDTALDLAKAQETLSFKIASTQQNFAKFISEVSGTDSFKSLANGMLGLANAAITFASALKDLIPLITVMLAFKVGKSLSSRIFGGSPLAGGSRVPGFARGGFVPGTGSGDTVPAMLEPGEFVIRKSAAQAFGADRLHGINKYASAGKVKGYSPKDLRATNAYQYERFIPFRDPNLKNSNITYGDIDSLGLEKPVAAGLKGSMFEAYIREIYGGNLTKDGSATFPDLGRAAAKKLLNAAGAAATIDGKSLDGTELKYRLTDNTASSYRSGLKRKFDENNVAANIPMVFAEGVKKFASGGSVGTDTVPALLTPGEFVVNKASAQAVGYGNLHKINKYAAGGVVQRLAGGGIAGAAIGGADSLLAVFSDINPLLLQFGASVASTTLQMNLAASIGSGVRKVWDGVKTSMANEKIERDDLNRQLAEQTTKSEAAFNDQIAASTNYANALSRVNPSTLSSTTRASAVDIAADKVRYKVQSSVKASGIGTQSSSSSLEQVAAGNALKSEVATQIAAIRKTTVSLEQQDIKIKQLNAVVGAFSDNNIAARQALDQYTSAIAITTVTYQDLEDAARKELDASLAKSEAESNLTASLNKQIKNSTLRGRIGTVLKEKGGELATQGVALVTASLITKLNSAADAASKLSDKAIESGDAQGAYTQSLIASAKAETASAVQTGASAGAAIGSIFGPFGTAVGGAIGAILGFSGALTVVTDFLGFTNSKAEAEEKAIEARRSASIVKSDKIVSNTFTASDPFKKINPEKANSILAKGTKDFIQNNLTDNAITNNDPEIKAQAQSLFTAISQQIDDLVHAPANAGKSTDELRRNPAMAGLFSAFDELGKAIPNGTAIVADTLAANDAISTSIAKETQLRNDGIAIELKRIAISESLSRSLLALDTVLAEKNRVISQLDFISGGSLQAREPADLTDLSTRNIGSPEFANTLADVSGLGPDFQAEVDRFNTIIGSLNQEFMNTVGEYQKASLPEQEGIAAELENLLTNAGLDVVNAQAAVGRVQKGGDILEILNDIKTKDIGPQLDKLNEGGKVLAQTFASMVKRNEALAKAEKSRIEAVINYTKAQADSAKKIRDIGAARLDQSLVNEANFTAGRNTRLNSVSGALNGTSLRGRQITGGAADLQAISAQLEANKTKQAALSDESLGSTTKARREQIVTEQASLANEANRFTAALAALTDTTEENAALQSEIARSQEARSKVRGAVTDLAFGTNSSRRDFFKTGRQANLVSLAGNTDVIPQKSRQAVLGLLEQFKDVKLSAFGGVKGQAVIDNITRNAMLRMGASTEETNEYMANINKAEQDAIDKIATNLKLDTDRNATLVRIEGLLTARAGGEVTTGQRALNALLGLLPGFANGGSIFKSRGTDTVPAMLTPGEFVIKKSTVDKVGVANLHALNDGTSYLAEGGQPTRRQQIRAGILARKRERQKGFTAQGEADTDFRDSVRSQRQESKDANRKERDRKRNVRKLRGISRAFTGGLGQVNELFNPAPTEDEAFVNERIADSNRLFRNQTLFEERAQGKAQRQATRDNYYTPEKIKERADTPDKRGFTKAQREENRKTLTETREAEKKAKLDPNGTYQKGLRDKQSDKDYAKKLRAEDLAKNRQNALNAKNGVSASDDDATNRPYDPSPQAKGPASLPPQARTVSEMPPQATALASSSLAAAKEQSSFSINRLPTITDMIYQRSPSSRSTLPYSPYAFIAGIPDRAYRYNAEVIAPKAAGDNLDDRSPLRPAEQLNNERNRSLLGIGKTTVGEKRFGDFKGSQAELKRIIIDDEKNRGQPTDDSTYREDKANEVQTHNQREEYFNHVPEHLKHLKSYQSQSEERPSENSKLQRLIGFDSNESKTTSIEDLGKELAAGRASEAAARAKIESDRIAKSNADSESIARTGFSVADAAKIGPDSPNYKFVNGKVPTTDELKAKNDADIAALNKAAEQEKVGKVFRDAQREKQFKQAQQEGAEASARLDVRQKQKEARTNSVYAYPEYRNAQERDPQNFEGRATLSVAKASVRALTSSIEDRMQKLPSFLEGEKQLDPNTFSPGSQKQQDAKDLPIFGSRLASQDETEESLRSQRLATQESQRAYNAKQNAPINPNYAPIQQVPTPTPEEFERSRAQIDSEAKEASQRNAQRDALGGGILGNLKYTLFGAPTTGESEAANRNEAAKAEQLKIIQSLDIERNRKKTLNLASGGAVDSIPAMLTPGEFVLNKSAVDRNGASNLHRLNRGGVVGFASGGFVGGKTAYLSDGGGAAGSMPDFAALNSSMKLFDTSVTRLIEGLPQEIKLSIASEGITVNLNSGDFLAKIPDIIKNVVMQEIQSKIGSITESVKTVLSLGR